MVTPYVKGELSDKDLDQFLKHIEHCSDCMDELDIYFTVYQALDLLDTGEKHEYDFKKLLQDSIRISKRRLLLNRVTRIVRAVLFCCAEILLVISIFTGVQVKLGHQDASVFQRVMLNFYRPPEQILEEESELESAEALSERISEIMYEQSHISRRGASDGKETES